MSEGLSKKLEYRAILNRRINKIPRIISGNNCNARKEREEMLVKDDSLLLEFMQNILKLRDNNIWY
jgi:hypothetical protein